MELSLSSGSKNESSATRLSLLSRVRLQDQAAWSELVELYGPLVAHWCHRCGLDSHATADCLQDVFAAVFKSIHSFQPQRRSGAFRSWIWTITANKIRDFRRRQRAALGEGGSTALARLHLLPGVSDEVSGDVDVEPTDGEEIRRLMARAMEQVRGEFEPKSWDVFIRSCVDQLPTQAVAEQFGITTAAVRKVRSRVLCRIRKQLGDLGDVL